MTLRTFKLVDGCNPNLTEATMHASAVTMRCELRQLGLARDTGMLCLYVRSCVRTSTIDTKVYGEKEVVSDETTVLQPNTQDHNVHVSTKCLGRCFPPEISGRSVRAQHV